MFQKPSMLQTAFASFFHPKNGITEDYTLFYSRVVMWMAWVICNLMIIPDTMLAPGHFKEWIFVHYICLMGSVTFAVYLTYRLPARLMPIAYIVFLIGAISGNVFGSFIGDLDISRALFPVSALATMPLIGLFPLFPKTMAMIIAIYTLLLITFRYTIFNNSPMIEETWLIIQIMLATFYGTAIAFHLIFDKLSEALLSQKNRIGELTKTNALLNISMSQNQFGLIGYDEFGQITLERGESISRIFGPIGQQPQFDQLSKLETAMEQKLNLCLNSLFDDVREVKNQNGSFLLKAYHLHDLTIISHIDMTKISRMEERLRTRQKLALIGEITSGVAHNYNNSLAIALSNLETIPISHKDAIFEEFIQPSILAIEQSAELSRKLLTLAGKQHFSWSKFDVSQAIGEMENLLSSAVGSAIQLSIETGDRAIIHSDRREFESAILNLIINSKMAIHHKHGKIRIFTEVEDDLVNVCVEDNGCGIPNEIQERIFDPFFSTKNLPNSSGLGLSTVKGFVEQSKGKVHLSSSSKGTRFYLEFPITKSNEEDEAPVDQKIDARKITREQAGKQTEVLIVDDNEAVAKSLARLIQSLGYQAHFEIHPSVALEFAKANPKISVCLLDLSMPEMDGIELGEKLLEFFPHFRLFLITGETSEERIREAKEKGFEDVYIKPVRAKQFKSLLEAVNTPKGIRDIA